AAQIRKAAIEADLHADLGWSEEQAEQDFPGFLQALHDQLHELARSAIPLGLHIFGQPADEGQRISTILQQLGEPFLTARDVDQGELFVADASTLPDKPAYQAVPRMLSPGATVPLREAVAVFTERAQQLDQRL